MSTQLQLFDEEPARHNLFFALRPTSDAGARIARVAEELIGREHLSGRPLPLERLHVSLTPVGSFADPVPRQIVDEAKIAAGTVAVAPFVVLFDRVASFGGGALALTGGEGVEGVVRLQRTLGMALAQVGIGLRQRNSFTPHVTIAYADRASAVSIEPISWTVSEFVLIDSFVGQSRHVVLDHWSLR